MRFQDAGCPYDRIEEEGVVADTGVTAAGCAAGTAAAILHARGSRRAAWLPALFQARLCDT